jgi:rhomboid family GlyGly-CTERM serine protease
VSRPSPPHRRTWLAIAALIAGMAVLQALPADARAALRFDRAALLDGELWRLFTAHLVHLGWAHWALNAMGLVLCGVLANPLPSPGRLLARLAVLGLGVSLMLLAFDPSLTHYVGLSGVLYGLFVLTLWPQARRGDVLGGVALATVLGWMTWQWVVGPVASEVALIGGAIVAQAHAYGVAGAIVLLMLERPFKWE